MNKVTLSNSRVFVCLSNLSMLDSAREAGIVLEHSCRTGKCGVCKAQVVAGETKIIRHEESLLEHEINAGIILTCCRTADSDVQLDVEDLGQLAAIKKMTLPCRIDSIALLAEDVVQIILRLPPNNSFRYLPGQYIDVIGVGGVKRSYSIANTFTQGGKIELQVKKVSAGVMSNYWFNDAKSSDLLRLDGPHGTFSFRDKPERNIIFLATGTGIAPVKSILEELEQNPWLTEGKNIYVYWGGRFADDLYWRPDFARIKPIFKPVLSRADNTWQGQRGYVQDALVSDGVDLSDAVIYACGSLEMIESAATSLTLQGLKRNCFFSDAFVSS
jgi:CDP-4-dehydro-6-deoxyglucose reductase, E3